LKRLSKLESIDESKSWLIGYVGNACSYGCSWFNGYAKYNPNKKENHILEAYNGTVKQLAKFKNFKESEFICSDYENFDYPKNSVIYCDPPYQSTKKYASDFDHERFWDWVRKMSTEGHHVYVSEYTAPDDFKCVWSKERSDGMGTYGFGEKQAKKVEKLFVYSK
jgi:DNA adenine methylase